jgi:PAS domain S-box-containing protein
MGVRTKSAAHLRRPNSLPWGYGVAVASVALVLGLKVLLDPLITEQSPFLLLAGAVMVSAWFGGLGPGLLATALSAITADYFFLPPVGSFTGLVGVGFLPVVLFTLQGVLITLLAQALHSARQRAEGSALQTQRHQEELRQSEERYRSVVEQAAENIFLVDAETKHVLESNAALQRSLGYSSEELERMTLYDVVAHDREDIDRNIGRTVAKGHNFIGDRQHRCKDGSLIDLEVSANVISYGGKEALCVVAHDVTERKRTEQKLRDTLDRLLALYEAGKVLGSSLKREEIGSELLKTVERVSDVSAAVVDLRDEQGHWHLLRTIGPEDLWRWARSTPEALATRRAALKSEGYRSFELQRPRTDGARMRGLCLPLRVHEHSIGVLEAYGPQALVERGTVDTLASLANQAASALENAWLYGELDNRRRQLQELVGKLVTAQEEEQRRVACEVHDGFTQMAAAAYRRLQTFMEHRPPEAAQDREELEDAIALVRQTIGEARRIIANLRPPTLDDFGVATAIRMQTEELRAEGFDASYEETLGGERLPATLETALFRVVQEALANVRKHAQTDRMRVTLGRDDGFVRLEVRDWGCGFESAAGQRGGPGEKVGLWSMRERLVLLGGSLEIHSEPGAGTSVVAEAPVPTTRKEKADGA